MTTYLSAPTLIMNFDGELFRARDLRAGQIILGLDSDGQYVKNEILSVNSNVTVEDWIRLKIAPPVCFDGVKTRQITCSPNQQFLLTDGRYCRALNLTTGDHLVAIHKISRQQEILPEHRRYIDRYQTSLKPTFKKVMHVSQLSGESPKMIAIETALGNFFANDVLMRT